MRFFFGLLLVSSIFFGFGCKQTQEISNQDCAQAEYPFACYLDNATAASDVNLCKEAGTKRINCLNAYQEILGTEVSCDELEDPGFAMECETQDLIK